MTLLVVLAALTAAPPTELERGLEALAKLDPNEAVARLEEARTRGPYVHEDHCRLYQGLAVAYAYLGQNERAVAMFDMLLALDPFRAISYTLSPRVTFLFERARDEAQARARPELEISWPRELRTDQPVPLSIGVVADPKAFMKTVRVLAREGEGAPFRAVEQPLAGPGEVRQVVLPPVEGARTTVVRDVYAVVLDAAGNEVALWANAARPRQISARYEPPAPWYARWYVWAGIATVAAGAAAGIAWAVTRPLPDTVPGRFDVQPR